MLWRTRSGTPVWTMDFEPLRFGGGPCDLPGCAASADRSVSFAHWFSRSRTYYSLSEVNSEQAAVKAVGPVRRLDVHLDFSEIAICEEGKVWSAGRVPSTQEGLDTLTESLLP